MNTICTSDRGVPGGIRSAQRWARMKAIVALVVLVVTALLGGSCASPAGSSSTIVGRWQEVGTPATLTFFSDGRVNIAAGPVTAAGRYSFRSPGKLRIELASEQGEPKATTYRATLSGDQMRLVDSEGASNDYERVR